MVMSTTPLSLTAPKCYSPLRGRRRRGGHGRLVGGCARLAVELPREPTEETEEQKCVQRVERAAPTSAPRERGLREGQEREYQRHPPGPAIREPSEQRDDQEQERNWFGEDETERAMCIKRLCIADVLLQ